MQAKQRQSMPLVEDKDNHYFRVRAYEAQVPNPRSLNPTPLLSLNRCPGNVRAPSGPSNTPVHQSIKKEKEKEERKKKRKN